MILTRQVLQRDMKLVTVLMNPKYNKMFFLTIKAASRRSTENRQLNIAVF